MSEPKNCWCGNPLKRVQNELVCSGTPLHDPFADGRPKVIRRLYIAGPMTGYPEANYPAFNEVERMLVGRGWEIVNPATCVTGNEAHYVDFIREDLRMMLDCHGVVTLDNWWESVGARNEVQVAGLLKMPIRPWEDWFVRTPDPDPQKEVV